MSLDLEWTLEMIGPDLPDVVTFNLYVEYDFRHGSPASYWHPADPDEMEVTRVTVAEPIGPGLRDFDFWELCLLPDEMARVETYIMENPPEADDGSDFYGDD